MATVNKVVFKHHKKKDGTYNVKISVFHKSMRKFISTVHFVSDRQLDENLDIKDENVNRLLDNMLDNYRLMISRLGDKLDLISCDELKVYLAEKDFGIDFIGFCTQHIQSLRLSGRDGSARNQMAVRNSLIDYFKKERIPILEVNSGMLYSYEKWLRTERTMTRLNQLGKKVTTIEKGMKDGGVYAHMRDLRTLFNEARKYFNNEDIGIVKIEHYPFRKYKIGSAPITVKRTVTVNEIKLIRDCSLIPGSRAELARDLFMLSFYLCGMNAVDLYHLGGYNSGLKRIEFCRSKTMNVRKDSPFISIKILPQIIPLLKKYMGMLDLKYSHYTGLDTAISKGMHDIRKIIGLPNVTFYWARHTFANLARNQCHFSLDDVTIVLNHVNEKYRTTDIYIEKDWGIVDKVQKKVLDLLK